MPPGVGGGLDITSVVGEVVAAREGEASLDARIDLLKLVGYASVEDGAVNTGTTVLPFDDTIPQNTEGDEYMTLAYAAQSTSNIVLIEITFNGTTSAGGQLTAALFKDSDANAMAVGCNQVADTTRIDTLHFQHSFVPGTISSITYKVRAGGDLGGTTTFNGAGSVRKYGGILLSSIKIKEFRP